MRNAGSTVLVLVCLLILAIIFSFVRPYWNKHWLTNDLKIVALYGTKNKIEEIKNRLDKVMKEEGRDFDRDDFYIEKDKNKNVTIGIEYDDQISFFGLVIKKLEFEVEVTEYFTEEMF